MELNRSLGQYIPRRSMIHDLDPRTKLLTVIILMPLLFILPGYYGAGIMSLLLAGLIQASHIAWRQYWQGLRPFLWLLLLLALLQMIFITGEVVWDLGPLKISREGILLAAGLSARIVLVLLMAQWLIYTTSLSDLTRGLESLLGPFQIFRLPVHELVMIMTIALSFFPLLLQEGERIHRAQLSRGACFKTASWKQKWKIMVSLLVPLFLSSVNRAAVLAEAMEIRQYRGGRGRTRLKQLRLGRRDYSLLFLVILLGLTLILYF